MVRTPTSRMMAAPCSGPAPPNATSTKSLGSCPCSTDSSRVRPAMRWLTMASMAAAAASTPSPTCWPSAPTAARAPAMSSRSRCFSPMGWSALMRASTALASVTVGSVPPRPKQAGPGTAPALRGPTCRMPPRST